MLKDGVSKDRHSEEKYHFINLENSTLKFPSHNFDIQIALEKYDIYKKSIPKPSIDGASVTKIYDYINSLITHTSQLLWTKNY